MAVAVCEVLGNIRPDLSIQLHDVGHLVPAEAHEAAVVVGTVPPHHHVGLEVWLPVHPVGRSGCPPLGVIGGGVAFGPHVVPKEAAEV